MPKKKTTTFILDNNGETFDRYTVIVKDAVFTMSENALSPNGVNMFSGELDYLGFKSVDEFIEHCEEQGSEIINIKDLDDDVIKAIRDREDYIKNGFYE